uniref:Uncharacterized protein n=1 Tax=Sipha flava TaxID=143950 RepID=A0A2S2Q9V4_9HEMI
MIKTFLCPPPTTTPPPPPRPNGNVVWPTLPDLASVNTNTVLARDGIGRPRTNGRGWREWETNVQWVTNKRARTHTVLSCSCVRTTHVCVIKCMVFKVDCTKII